MQFSEARKKLPGSRFIRWWNQVLHGRRESGPAGFPLEIVRGVSALRIEWLPRAVSSKIAASRSALIGLLCAFLCMAPVTVGAASFSCDGKLTAVGKMICTDSELSALDVRLTALYSIELAMSHSKRELSSSQRAWLKERRSKCRDESCLTALYRRRIDELNALIQQTASSLPALLYGEKAIPDHCAEDRGDIFFLKLRARAESVTGYIDGSQSCSDKILGPVAVTGRKVGKVALVQFDPRWRGEDNPAPAEAMIAVSGRHVFWVILSEVNVQSFIPDEVDHLIRLRKPVWDDDAQD